jgi:hypothetical protein
LQAPGDELDLGRAGGARQHCHELVATGPRQRVAVAQGAAQARRGHPQHLVADRVPEAVVDFLEAVQSQGGHRESLSRAARVGDHHAQPVRQQQAVGQFGQAVVGRQVAQPLFGRVLDRHVAPDHEQGCIVAAVPGRDAQLEPGIVPGRFQARLDQRGAGRVVRLHQRVAHRALVGLGEQGDKGAAAQVAVGAEDPAGAAAGEPDQPGRGEAEHHITGRFHQAVETRRGRFLVGQGR